MLISEGKYYKRKNGEVVGPIVKTAAAYGTDYVFGVGMSRGELWTDFPDHDTFTVNGEVFTSTKNEYDLIEECNADGSPIAKVVTTYAARSGVTVAIASGDIPKGAAVAVEHRPDGKVIPATEVIGSPILGRKHDTGKLWAGTVLAGFWCDEVRFALMAHAGARNEPPELSAVFDAMFDVTLPVAKRFVDARSALVNILPERVPFDALTRATRVGTYGARKYERDNWLHVEDGINRYYEAHGRHVLQILEGKWIDTPEDPSDAGSGLANLDHICWCVFAGATLADRTAT